ncbi:MAG TPA: hypothetical protein VGF45_22575 [Polyangia bacterium]
MKIPRRALLRGSAAAASLMLTRPQGAPAFASGPTTSALSTQAGALLAEWCDGLLRLQIDDPLRPREHGAFSCPACSKIHGRCGDAVYPLLHMAKTTGHDKYLRAAIQIVDWMKNVESPEGAFTNDPNAPTSWKGITVFAAIALGEALHWHGDLLEVPLKQRWMQRLRKAGDYVFETFTMETGNINYPVTAAYALTLLGNLFDEPRYRAKGRAFARDSLAYFTAPNRLLFGEGRPQQGKSPKGLLPVDLGYNVEESLPALVLYGLAARDEEVLQVASASLAAHLEFMLPDGGWDNSWGTRNYKWTYWGSRTSDGCQPAYALLADRNPTFATAAARNTALLRACTREGLLHGGPHYVAHGVPPCVHHTFCHAKALTTIIDHEPKAPQPTQRSAPLPRETARRTRSFPELDVALLAEGPWRATVSGYDRQYRKEVFSGMGGALSMLWHRDFGPVLSASLASDSKLEPNNLQQPPGGDWTCLTPRLETRSGDAWFSNIFDLGAQLAAGRGGRCDVRARLLDAGQKDPPSGSTSCELSYRLSATAATITARVICDGTEDRDFALVLPVISPDGEAVRRVNDKRVTIAKPKGLLLIEASVPLAIDELPARERVFNITPGFAAVPFRITMPAGTTVTCTIRSARG